MERVVCFVHRPSDGFQTLFDTIDDIARGAGLKCVLRQRECQSFDWHDPTGQAEVHALLVSRPGVSDEEAREICASLRGPSRCDFWALAYSLTAADNPESIRLSARLSERNDMPYFAAVVLAKARRMCVIAGSVTVQWKESHAAAADAMVQKLQDLTERTWRTLVWNGLQAEPFVDAGTDRLGT